MLTTIEWHGSGIRMIDQRKIPRELKWVVCRNCGEVIRAIRKMVIRGAPAIGIAGAMGLALGAESIKGRSYPVFRNAFDGLAHEMAMARPTAVNLRWAVARMSRLLDGMENRRFEDIKAALRLEADRILAEDVEINRKIGQNGLALIPKKAALLTHCNTGSFATGGYGTALGILKAAHEAGKGIEVIADETRPWLQGLRLTAFELMEDRIPVTVIADSAAGLLMRRKRIQAVVTGADRIAANGDVANKIGTYQIAVLAKENRIPFYVAGPCSTIDPSIRNGDLIPLEERDPEEITHFAGKALGPAGVKALNPAFDVTPAKYVTAIITERGIIRPPYTKEIRKQLKQ